MKKIVCYGFGWSGACMVEFLDCFEDIEVLIVDDAMDLEEAHLSSDRFVCLESCLSLEIGCYLITVFSSQKAMQIAHKLQALHIPPHRIKHAYNESFRSKMGYLVAKFFGGSERLLQMLFEDDFKLTLFHARLDELVSEHRQTKPTRALAKFKQRKKIDQLLKRRNIFSKILSTSVHGSSLFNPWIAYPGFHIAKSNTKTKDKNFYFIEPVDFQALANRPKDLKLVACFGNSALRVEYRPTSHTIPHFLQEYLDAKTKDSNERYVVVNFGVVGYSLYDQMLLYNALVYPLRPEFVLCFFGGIDWRLGPISCQELLQTHHLLYSQIWEQDYKKAMQSNMPLYAEMSNLEQINHLANNHQAITQALALRLEQFGQIVRANNTNRHANAVAGGGQFYAFIQPLLPCKLNLSQQEQEMSHKEQALRDKIAPFEHEVIKAIPLMIKELKKALKERGGERDLFDLNEAIRHQSQTLFSNWIHLNPKGNALVANVVANLLTDRLNV